MRYDGFGGLVESSQNRGNPVADEYALDALGNVLQHDQNRNANFAGRATDASGYSGPHLTATASDPLSSLRNGGGPLITTLTTTDPTYDASGNQIASDSWVQRYISTTGGTDNFDTAPTGESWGRSYFDAAERLRVSQRNYFFSDPGGNPRARVTFQEYFYDALGRRIAMRSRRDSTCTDTGDPTPGWDCAQTMERFVWDGAQLLAERRDYGWWGEDPATLNGNGSSTGSFYGTTTYAYALNLFGPDTPWLLFPASGGTVLPEASWRGTYEAGTGTDGSNVTSYSWPGQQTGLYLAPDLRRTTTIVERNWYGSLVDGKADPSGLVYDRNRYYDPTAGRFTQEDPAGLAGGVNLYGYAGADPANSSDPFGLCPKDAGGDGKSPYLTDCPKGSRGYNEVPHEPALQHPAVDPIAVATGFASGLLEGAATSVVDNAVFWSGKDAEAAATEWAAANGGKTLGMTNAGNATAKATEGMDWLSARPIWLRASVDFANRASGDVHVFQSSRGVFLNSIWRDEYKVLMTNPNLRQIIYHIVP
jgi:RHS repeat-associated protein